MMRTPATLTAVLGILACLGPGCDDKPTATKRPPERAPVVSTPPVAPPAPPPPPDPLAGLLVDELGVLLQTQRIDMAAPDAERKIKAALADLPVKQKNVPVRATRGAKTQHVGVLVRGLGQAGAREIVVKTPTRSGSEAELKLTAQEAVGSTPDCAVVAMVKKDNSCAVWRVKGGTAARFSKGLAGPDLSTTYDGIKNQMSSCSSSNWFLAGEENVIWGLVFDLGQVVAKADPPPKATQAVFVHEAPVAGRAVQVSAK